ncbi:MAG: tetratricopeptide repeat protein [Gemmataceae bacterium]
MSNRMQGRDAASQLPARDWSQTQQDWQQNRDQVREDWQQHRDNAREDWQNHFDDHYGRYGGWYGGYAPGNWARWDYMWDNHPVAAAVGVTWWGANAISSLSGYSEYSNSYSSDGGSPVYSEPTIAEPMPVEYAAAQPVTAAEETPFDKARAAFYEGRYTDALQLTDEALKPAPHDAVLHEFRSLVLFALQRYQEAAATIHPVLDVGPGWDWKTLSSLYPNTEIYTQQLRLLEENYKQTKGPGTAFLLGYHYLTCGHQEYALAMFQAAAKANPTDRVAASLAKMMAPATAPASSTPLTPAPPAIPAERVVGKWSANSAAGKYDMTLNADGTFNWVFTKGARTKTMKGVYTTQGNVLAMEPDRGGTMLAELTLTEPGSMHFKMIGGPDNDAGLSFRSGTVQ